jgi:hypothetical protein
MKAGDYAMRHALITSAAILAALITLCPETGFAQQAQLPNMRPPPPPPIKPYTAVTVTPPKPFGDPSFQAFQQQLAAIAAKKDRAALTKLVVAQGFFWMQDKDIADKGKSGIDNLAKAIGLDAKDGSGWDNIAALAADPTAAELPDKKGIVCGPADPALDPKAFEALGEATHTDPSEWGYPLKDGVEARAAAQPTAPVVEKLGMYLVRVLPDSAPPENPDQPTFLHVAMPDGKTGFIPADSIAPLGNDEMCYTKDAGGWKITGYFGGASQ